MRLEALINDHYNHLTPNDREIAGKILQNKQTARQLNSTRLSEFLNISRTTLVRFMKKLGISTYAEFKLLLAEEAWQQGTAVFDMKEIVADYHVMIDELKKHDYGRVCQMIRQAGTIYVYGSGNEQKVIAEEFKRIFLIFGKCCVDLFDLGEVEFARRRFRKNDLFLAISLSGEGKEALRVMECVRESELQTVSLTRWANNSLARMCQENLYVGTKTVCQTGSPSYEMVAAFYILLDILAVQYLEQKEGQAEKKEAALQRKPEYIEALLNRHYHEFGENERYICHFLTAHYSECARETIGRFAHRCGVSQTMLVRFAKKLGLSGYGELKAYLKIGLQEPPSVSQNLMEALTDSYHKMMDDLMKKPLTSFFEAFQKADRIFIYGSGSSQARAASEMKRIFLPLKETIHVHGHDMAEALQKTASSEDLVILISLSGESQAVTALARILRTRGVPSVSVTRMQNNTLASLCTENLYINSIQMQVKNGLDYEISTPYFILIEYLYLSCQLCAQKFNN